MINKEIFIEEFYQTFVLSPTRKKSPTRKDLCLFACHCSLICCFQQLKTTLKIVPPRPHQPHACGCRMSPTTLHLYEYEV
jgi:hypothetical protein